MLGIDFVPLSAPLKDRLEALSAGIFMVLMVGLIPIGGTFTVYVLFFTKFWPIFCVYLFWIWIIDRDTPEKGGRTSQWVRSWTMFTYFKNYFPITMKAVPGFKADPKLNYLACCFPHGYLPFGIMATFLTNAFEEAKILFPEHISHGFTLGGNYNIPVYREFLLAMGMCSASPKSISWFLNHPGGGKVAGLIVGGAAESFYCHEGGYRLVLKNRKGFIKMALKNGSPIIPTFSFGQTKNFNQIVFPDGSVLQKCQLMMKKITRIAFLAVNGRGLFQYTFGFIPLQTPINVVIGHPITVKRIDQPTQEDIDALHSLFIGKLTELFETFKHEYETDPEKCFLTIC